MKVLRQSVSVLLLFSFLVVTFTSIGLEVLPHGRLTGATITFLGVSKFSMKLMHDIFGYGMLGLALLHTIINYKPMLNHIKKSKSGAVPSKTLVIATTITSALFAFALLQGADADKINAKYAANSQTTQSVAADRTEIR